MVNSPKPETQNRDLETVCSSTSVLIAGCGSIGKRHARILSELGVQDLRACDPVADQLDGLCESVTTTRSYADFSIALEEQPDAVFICTPPKMHVPMSLQALQGGAHVFCEKPLSTDLTGVEDLEAATLKSGRVFMVGLCFRFHEGLLRAKKALDEGRIGRLISIRALMGEHLPEVRPDYRTLFSFKYSGALDLMHDIDLALWYAGSPVSEVKALCRTYSDLGFQAPDLAEILIDFESRCVASVHLDFFQRPRRRQLELIASEGCVIIEFARWNTCEFSVFEASRGSWETETLLTDRDDMFRAEDREFLAAVAGGGKVSCPLAEARKSVEVVLAAMSDI